MLEQKDLQAIAVLLESQIRASETRMIEEMDSRINKAVRVSETRMAEEMKQLERRLDFRFSRRINQCVGKTAAQILHKVDKRIAGTEEFLLDEMERYDRKNEQRFHELTKRVEMCEDIYRVVNTEKTAVDELLKSNDDMEKRLSVVEKKLA